MPGQRKCPARGRGAGAPGEPGQLLASAAKPSARASSATPTATPGRREGGGLARRGHRGQPWPRGGRAAAYTFGVCSAAVAGDPSPPRSAGTTPRMRIVLDTTSVNVQTELDPTAHPPASSCRASPCREPQPGQREDEPADELAGIGTGSPAVSCAGRRSRACDPDGGGIGDDIGAGGGAGTTQSSMQHPGRPGQRSAGHRQRPACACSYPPCDRNVTSVLQRADSGIRLSPKLRLV